MQTQLPQKNWRRLLDASILKGSLYLTHHDSIQSGAINGAPTSVKDMDALYGRHPPTCGPINGTPTRRLLDAVSQRSSTAPFRLQMDSCRCRYLWPFHDHPGSDHRQYYYSTFAKCLRCYTDGRAVGPHWLHACSGSGNSTYRISCQDSGSKTSLSCRVGRFHDWLGPLWTLVEPAYAYFLPTRAGSNGSLHVAAGHYPAVDRISGERARYSNGSARHPHLARSCLWANVRRLHRHLSGLAVDLFH